MLPDIRGDWSCGAGEVRSTMEVVLWRVHGGPVRALTVTAMERGENMRRCWCRARCGDGRVFIFTNIRETAAHRCRRRKRPAMSSSRTLAIVAIKGNA